MDTIPKVLLVEDDEQLAGFLMRFLSSEGYTTSYAAGQKDALKLFEEESRVSNLYETVRAQKSGEPFRSVLTKPIVVV